uniref:Putative heparan sulfate 2-o-sulfotransferase n=1 Tax=Ixodes ricinus TaxID=34613 RepID=A0A0K8RKH7_IXORI
MWGSWDVCVYNFKFLQSLTACFICRLAAAYLTRWLRDSSSGSSSSYLCAGVFRSASSSASKIGFLCSRPPRLKLTETVGQTSACILE